mgnify:CR=1 FL=1
MKKIEKRTVVCLALTVLMMLGLGLFVVRFFLYGGKWASFAANRHLYSSSGTLAVGRVLDRDGDVLSWVNDNGERQYYDNATVRKATLTPWVIHPAPSAPVPGGLCRPPQRL